DVPDMRPRSARRDPVFEHCSKRVRIIFNNQPENYWTKVASPVRKSRLSATNVSRVADASDHPQRSRWERRPPPPIISANNEMHLAITRRAPAWLRRKKVIARGLAPQLARAPRGLCV